jgi:hypothetical protein
VRFVAPLPPAAVEAVAGNFFLLPFLATDGLRSAGFANPKYGSPLFINPITVFHLAGIHPCA